jgi:hypothetical protein
MSALNDLWEPRFARQGVFDDFDGGLDVHIFRAFDKEIFSACDAALRRGDFVLRDIDAHGVAVAVTFLIDDLAAAGEIPVDENLGGVGIGRRG